MTRSLISLALSAVLSLTVISQASAQDPKPQNPPAQDAGKQEPKKEEPKKEEPKSEDQKKADEYEKVIKDLKKVNGAFTFYQRKKDILMEVPEDKLGKVVLFQPTFATGVNDDVQAGSPLGYVAVHAFRIEKNEDSIWLVRPNLRFRWNDNDPLAVASERSFLEAVLASFKIEQTNPLKKLHLINVTQLFYGDTFRVGETLSQSIGGQYAIDREKSGPDYVKSFADNAVVSMKLHFYNPRGVEPNPILALLGLSAPEQLEDTRSAPMRVTYNMWFRNEKSDFVPRLADPRVGYFTQDFYSLDKFLESDRTERYMLRWNLKKKDPTAELSEVVKPIVWTIDPSVPPQYREAVKEGVLRWNKAFEQLGYKNAVRVQDKPEDPEYDHADGRYNVIRWTVTPDVPYAIAYFRSDPFTAEIMNAAVNFDANLLAYAVDEHQRVAKPGARNYDRANAVLLRDPQRTETDEFFLFASDKERARAEFAKKMGKEGWTGVDCHYGSELASSAAFGYTTLTAGGLRVSKEDYAKQLISDLISHEVGHCLGLRHNFIGSTNLTTEQLADDSITSKQGISGSVMDYTPVNIQAILKGNGNFYTPTLGPYDFWAIKYGYTETGASRPEDEKALLATIASQSGLPGHAYMGDESSNKFNPYVVRHDSAKDPLNYSAKMLLASQRVMKYAIEEMPRAGQSYGKRTDLVMGSIMQTFKQGQLAARFVGGMQQSRNFRSDIGQKSTLSPVSAADQRRAINQIAYNCFSPKAFNLPENVLMNLSFDENDEGSYAVWTAPLRDFIGTNQTQLYAMLMSASTTDRIVENEYKWGKNPNAYRIDEHYSILMNAVFSEIGQNKSVAPLRRDLQRYVVNSLTIQAGAPQGGLSEDVRMLAGDWLRKLDTKITTQLANTKKLDNMTVVHLRDTKAFIERFQNRNQVGR